MTDELERLARMRPPTAADDDWANSASGRMALSAIHHRARTGTADHADLAHPVRIGPLGRPRWWRPALAVSAAVLIVGGATAAAVVITRDPTNPAQVTCMRAPSAQADSVGISLANPTPSEALRACSSRWASLFPGDRLPSGFAVCVYPVTKDGNGDTSGGGQVVIPATTTSPDSTAACTAAGFDPIKTS